MLLISLIIRVGFLGGIARMGFSRTEMGSPDPDPDPLLIIRTVDLTS